jgi:CheY-like chemotaxis protein
MNIAQLNILLADDDTDDCLFFEEALGNLQQPIHLTTVHDGEQLMHLLINSEDKLPDVLFLDLNMPRKNGFECLLEIKLNEKLKQLPVIIFSTSFEQDVVNQLHENGALYFIRKPSGFAQFKIIIQQALELITRENIVYPTKEKFVITVQKNVNA